MGKLTGLQRFVGGYVVTNQPIPRDELEGGMPWKGTIPPGTSLFVQDLIGGQYFNLSWIGIGGGRAASHVHHTKLFLHG